MTCELRVTVVMSCIYCTSYELHLLLELRVNFTFELQATSYVHTSYELLFIARIMSNLLYKSCKLLFIARVTSYFLHASYNLLFISRVTSHFSTINDDKD